jgi:preprotein translocase YajC subunit
MRRQEQERQALLTNIKKNDKVITSAGIYGTVISVAEKEDEIVVKVDDNVRLKMVKNSILRNLTNEEAAKEAEAAKKAAKGGKAAEKVASTGVTTKETRVTSKEGGA